MRGVVLSADGGAARCRSHIGRQPRRFAGASRADAARGGKHLQNRVLRVTEIGTGAGPSDRSGNKGLT